MAAHSLAAWSLKNDFVGSFDSFRGHSIFFSTGGSGQLTCQLGSC